MSSALLHSTVFACAQSSLLLIKLGPLSIPLSILAHTSITPLDILLSRPTPFNRHETSLLDGWRREDHPWFYGDTPATTLSARSRDHYLIHSLCPSSSFNHTRARHGSLRAPWTSTSTACSSCPLSSRQGHDRDARRLSPQHRSRHDRHVHHVQCHQLQCSRL